VGAIILLADGIPQLIIHFFGNDHPNITNRHYVILACCAVFLPLSFAQNISKFKINSFLSIFSLIGMVILLFVQCVFMREHYGFEAPRVEIVHNHINPTNFFAVSIIFCDSSNIMISRSYILTRIGVWRIELFICLS